MKRTQDVLAYFFIFAVGVLAVVSVFGVWDLFDKDVIFKSFQTIGLLAIVASIALVAVKHMESRAGQPDAIIYAPDPLFSAIRKMTLGILIMSAAILALLGVMAIWDVITDKSVLWKTIGSLTIAGFASLIIVGVCRQREQDPTLTANKSNGSAALIVLAIVFGYLFMVFGGMFR